MRAVSLLIVVMCLVGGTSGCRTCDDRPRLLDRLFHKDRDDCPSRSSRDAAAAARPCPDLAARDGGPMQASLVPGGYGSLHTTPVSGSMPMYSLAPFTGFPSPAPPSGAMPRDDELPPPGGGQRLPATSMPIGTLAPPLPVNPTPASTPANAGRFAGESRK